MVNIRGDGPHWRATLTCSRCGTARIEQAHPRTKPWAAIEATAKTTARTLGWQVGADTALCGACRRRK